VPGARKAAGHRGCVQRAALRLVIVEVRRAEYRRLGVYGLRGRMRPVSAALRAACGCCTGPALLLRLFPAWALRAPPVAPSGARALERA